MTAPRRRWRVRTIEVQTAVRCATCGESLPTPDHETLHIGFNPEHYEIECVYERVRTRELVNP